MTKRETAAERRAREAQEAREAEARWEEEKPMRLLRALARANDLGIGARVYHRYDNTMYYEFNTSVDYNGTWSDPVIELSEYVMSKIENDLDAIQEERKRRQHLAQVKQDVIARLTDEEKQALGLI